MSSTAWLILTIVGALGSAACLYGIYGDKKRGYPALKAVDSQFEMPDMRFRYTPEELFACLEKLGTEGRQVRRTPRPGADVGWVRGEYPRDCLRFFTAGALSAYRILRTFCFSNV